MVEETLTRKNKIRWSPALIKSLRGKRTQAEFGSVLGAPKNTVWRWEAGHSRPDQVHAERLSALAEQEGFFKQWNLVGSMSLLNDLDGVRAEIAALFRKSLERTARQLAE